MPCIAAMEINQTGKMAKNQPSSCFQVTAVQSTRLAVSGSASKCVTSAPMPPTSINPIGTAMNSIPIIRINIWNTSV